MTPDRMAQALEFMRLADQMLLDGGELLASAHLSLAIEMLENKLRIAGDDLGLRLV